MSFSKTSHIKHPEKKQKPISSFFSSNRKPAATTTSTTGKYQTVKTTPERVLASRSSSFLQRSNSSLNNTNSGNAFEEIPSSDTSFESPEVNNFRNPTLARSFSSMGAKSDRKGGNTGDSKNDIIDLTNEDEVPEPRSSPLRNHASSNSFGGGANKENVSSFSSASSSQSNNTQKAKRSHSDLLATLNGIPRKVPKRAALPFKTPSATFLDFSTSPVSLSEEQKDVIRLVVQDGLNVFYTGSAGTGKSVVLRELVARLNVKYNYSNVGVTASTGLAACNIGGQTIHRFLGIGLGEAPLENLVSSIKKKNAMLKRWKTLKVLIIDEVSMVHAKLFNKLNYLGKALRNSPHLPFGGIQIVCTGDFFQLPPVVKNGAAEFCFEADTWKETIQKTILLTEVFRQKGDNELIEMLNSLRYGQLDDRVLAKFDKLQRKIHYEDGLEPTELFPLREDVKRANDYRLNQLPSKPIKYLSMDTTRDPMQSKMLDNLMCERELTLKVGAQVMYLKNLDENIVNGSIGTVLYFLTTQIWDKVSVMYGEDLLGSDPQVLEEMKLLSNKIQSQSATWDDAAEIATFESIPDDRKSRFQQLCLVAKDEKLDGLYPVIKFNVPGRDPRVILVQREEFQIDVARLGGGAANGAGDNKVCRIQLPLLLSWALSIHKAQGQTINRLRIDLKKVFEKGQVYVALSRATSKESLEILNFDPRKIHVADKVKQFYNGLERRSPEIA